MPRRRAQWCSRDGTGAQTQGLWWCGSMVDGVGELDAAFETMKRELYILREKGAVQDDGTFTYHYKLGPRAFVE